MLDSAKTITSIQSSVNCLLISFLFVLGVSLTDLTTLRTILVGIIREQHDRSSDIWRRRKFLELPNC